MNLNDLPLNIGDMDAFHVPIVAVTSNDLIRPGDWIKFVGPTAVMLCEKAEADGLANPWGKITRVGEMFWCCVNPDKIDGKLTHKFKLKVLL